MNDTKKEMYLSFGYYSSFPTWLLFLIFIKKGYYNGYSWSIRWGRILCWFNKHRLYLKNEKDQYHRHSVISCTRCGYQFNDFDNKAVFLPKIGLFQPIKYGNN